jgi:hypothetical protein
MVRKCVTSLLFNFSDGIAKIKKMPVYNVHFLFPPKFVNNNRKELWTVLPEFGLHKFFKRRIRCWELETVLFKLNNFKKFK